MSTVIECPNHEGAYDCTPFCRLCEGNQEYEVATCNNGHPQTGWLYCVESDKPGLCHRFETAVVAPYIYGLES